MLLLTELLESCDANTCANGVNDQKGHAAPHFNYLDLWNAMVPLMTPLASCDTDVDTNDIT